ncbi:hypothetical protein QS257_10415 [Terrilactibacillus sp. S3-3]|nr:hypothetical protein QS257_10415 [Terrilactibacillus sp. S3-3]
MPRSLANRGDRLAYSNGIVLLAALASFLIAIFRAHTGALIPLYAIGVVSFTVAQIGLVRRWHKVKGTFWKGKMTINLIGAVLSAVVAFVFAVTKFTGGAWIVLVVLPLLILFSLAIHRHYDAVAEQLRINYKTDRPEAHRVTSIVLVSGIHRVVKKYTLICQEPGNRLYRRVRRF